MKKGKAVTRLILPIVLCLLMVMSLGYFAYSLYGCGAYFDHEAAAVAQKYNLENAGGFQKKITTAFNRIPELAAEMAGVTDLEAIDAKGTQVAKEEQLLCLQFLKEGEANFRYGDSVGSSSSKQFAALIAGGQFDCSELFVDQSIGRQCVAVFAPVAENTEIDGVIAYYPVDALMVQVDMKQEKLLCYSCFAQKDGAILQAQNAEDFPVDKSHNFYTLLENLSKNKTTLDSFEQQAKSGLNAACELNIQGVEYVISSIPVQELGTDCLVVNIFRRSDLLQNEYTLYDRMIGSSAGMIVLSVLILVIYLVIRYQMNKQKYEVEETDPMLGGNTYARFQREADELLSVNRQSNFSIVYIDINNYTYITQHFQSEAATGLLRYISKILQKIITENESYGHITDAHFVLMLRSGNKDEFTDRLKLIRGLIANNKMTREENFGVSVSMGVYPIGKNRNFSIREMTDRAGIASTVNQKEKEKLYTSYDDRIRSAYLREAEIESKMDLGLKNREYKVFYQPKYNMEQDRIDGAEALIRWYDAEKQRYIAPVDFVPLFEVNGFIVKLDHYVMSEVCSYLKESTERGDKTVPVSVNVSAVTATKPDFLAFYVQEKKKYGIADGFLTLEFTESFAFENYNRVQELVNVLHQNGFKCSIDDFGSGYSSMQVLKTLQMDELKLDIMFLEQGVSLEKDELLLRSVITLGRYFGIKVTQEGVERAEQLKKLKEMGCDVIQGYYYARPLMLSDYVDFVNGNTSMNSIIHAHMQQNKN